MTESSLPEELIFLQALEIPSAAERAAFLDRACGPNQALRAEVEELLRAHERSGDLLDLLDDLPATADLPASEGPGTVIGPYKLLERIGEGGMGTVWMAEQTEPIRRRVAVKVVKEGMDSRQVLARFEAERQALALMDHPHIAKVLDAGRTPAGRPYFVMELVKGQPITTYCDEKCLGVRQRLELFGDVCRAVQHAHHKGVIHRDLKPSNVLAAPYDGRPVVKVIDFGLAKATGQRLTEQTLFTGFGAVVGTLEYMSPEQAEVNNQDIDTRSDIYALGVLLYELLTGSTPLTRQRVKEATLLEMLRAIREEEPPRPSTRLSDSKESLPAISAQRQSEPAQLTKLVRGELDWIVMKALEKDRNRRYETANAFALDVQRYLADEPVQACPPSAGYRLRKFVRRNKGPVLAAGIVVFLLVAGIVGTTTGLLRALAAEQKTDKALTRLTAEQEKTQAALTSARQALDTLTEDVVEKMFARQPELDAAQKAFLRKVLSFYETLTRQVGRSAEARWLQAKGHFKVASLRGLLDESRQAVRGYRRAAALLERLAGEFPEVAKYRHSWANTQANLGLLLAQQGKDAAAEKAFRRGIALQRKLEKDLPKVPRHRAELADKYGGLAVLLERQGKFGEAAKAYQAAVGRLEKLAAGPGAIPPYRQSLAYGRSGLAGLLRKQGKNAAAEKLYRRALTVQREHRDRFPNQPSLRRQLADSYHGIAIVHARQHRGRKAEAAFRKALALRQQLAEDYPNVVRYRRELARLYLDLGSLLRSRGKKGVATALRSALVQWQHLAAKSPQVPDYQNELAATLGKLATLSLQGRDFATALSLLKQARPHNRAALAARPRHPYYRLCYRNNLQALARTYAGLGDHARLATAAQERARYAVDAVKGNYLAACMLCFCAQLAARDPQLTDERRMALARGYCDRALGFLRRAVARGYKDVARLQSDHDLDPLRSRQQFHQLLAGLEKKSN
jgi:serine/threonine protein kinase